MSEEYLHQMNEGEDHDENMQEHEEGEMNQEYHQEEEQDNTPHEDNKNKKNSKVQKNPNKKNVKKNIKKSSAKEAQIDLNAPNKTQMKKYKDTSIKAMNYRVDIYKTQEKCTKLEKDIQEKHKKLEKVNKERDNLKNYLNRLEKVMQQKTDTDNNDSTKINTNNKSKVLNTNTSQNESENMMEQSEDKTNEMTNLNKLTISMTGTSPVITMDDGQGNKNIIKSKNGLMKFLYKIYVENQNLKNFQTQVFNLSKNYDDINNILAESVSGFQNIAKSTGNEEIQNEVDTRLKELKAQVESSLEQKQNEYNAQLSKKEEDINMLNKAYENIYKEIQQKKSDKLHEQKTIEDLNSQIEILETKLAYLKQKQENKKNSKP